MVRASSNLSRLYGTINEDTIARGLIWYPEAYRLMEELGQETGYLTTQAAAVMAVTSRAFYRAIMGDEDAVALDRWALYAAGHRRRRAPDPGPTWRFYEDAYRRAAKRAGIAARDFQAITWIAVREGKKTRRGVVPKLGNIV